MSYQVLARKWRPKNFQALIGQEHVVNVVANALAQNRLHHAYLFTGTRGVGKTTIARIFAKSLNCLQGITNEPCGTCDACIDIDQGKFVDLLEIDAASKTKVDDTREILDNVQYAPSRGRFKVYLIDEVHMLSRHSFNALLKTLEEPPEHVKFILATTDPQKLPITVLSRCLQFHLKALTVKQIEQKLIEILSAEQVSYDKGSLTLLAKAARGSMRDCLSLTDQAIAQGQGSITLANIQQMLGGIDQHWVYQLLIALLKQDGEGLMALSQQIASYAPSYSRLFAELIQLLHQIAMYQIVEQSFDLPSDLLALLKKFSRLLSAEDVQLYYQISLNGRKDLPYAHDEQAAFDMTLLRLLAFKPMLKSDTSNTYEQLDSPLVKPDGVDADKQQSPNESVENFAKNTVTTHHSDNAHGIADDDVINDNEVSSPDTPLPQPPGPFHELSHAASQSPDTEPEQHTEKYAEQQDIETSIEQQLNVEALAIEQEAAALSQLASIDNSKSKPDENCQPSVIHSNQSEGKRPSYQPGAADENSNNFEDKSFTSDNQVSSVIATRNMLRSRKKSLEKQVKKPRDANLRHLSELENNVISCEVEQISQTKEAIKFDAAKSSDSSTLTQPQVPFDQNNIDPKVITKANQVDKWSNMIDSMQLTARIRQLAIHATISPESTDDHLILQLDQATRHLNTDAAHQQLALRMSEFLSRQVKVSLNIVEETVADPYQIQSQINDKRLQYAKSVINEDNIVIALQNTFQAILDENSILPR